MKSAPRSARPRLRELLRGHHPERDAGVDDVCGKRPGSGDAALAERAEAGLARERHSFLERPEGLPVEEVRRVHGVTALPELLGERADSVGQPLDVVEQHDFAHLRPSSTNDPLSWNILRC